MLASHDNERSRTARSSPGPGWPPIRIRGRMETKPQDGTVSVS
jgi:hypothetical protein